MTPEEIPRTPQTKCAYALGFRDAIEALQIQILNQGIDPLTAFTNSHKYLDVLAPWALDPDPSIARPHPRILRRA